MTLEIRLSLSIDGEPHEAAEVARLRSKFDTMLSDEVMIGAEMIDDTHVQDICECLRDLRQICLRARASRG